MLTRRWRCVCAWRLASERLKGALAEAEAANGEASEAEAKTADGAASGGGEDAALLRPPELTAPDVSGATRCWSGVTTPPNDASAGAAAARGDD